jgi:hypothetical protein
MVCDADGTPPSTKVNGVLTLQLVGVLLPELLQFGQIMH